MLLKKKGILAEEESKRIYDPKAILALRGERLLPVAPRPGGGGRAMTQVETERQLHGVDATGPYELAMDNTSPHVWPWVH
jgi:hypothetical protein